MTSWVFTGGVGALNAYELSAATRRSLSFDIRDAATVQWELDGRHPNALLIEELFHDLKVYRDGSLIFRGRMGIPQDTIGENHSMKCVAVDYRGKLSYRLLKEGMPLVEFGMNPNVFLENLLDDIQAEVNGNEGITDGVRDTVPIEDMETSPGESFTDAADRLSEAFDFEWGIEPDMTWNVWLGGRGGVKTTPLELGSSIASLTMTSDEGQYANVIVGEGAGFMLPEVIEAADIATDPYGRWEWRGSWPDVETQAENDGRTAWLLEELNERTVTHKITLKQGWWQGKSSLWIGDTVPLRVRSGRLDINRTVRVENLNIELDDNGVEVVTVSVR